MTTRNGVCCAAFVGAEATKATKATKASSMQAIVYAVKRRGGATDMQAMEIMYELSVRLA